MTDDKENVLPERASSGGTDRIKIHTASFDERGDFGLKKESSKTLVIAASDIVDPDAFAAIATRYPKNTRQFKKTKKVEDSLKFRTSSDNIRASVVQEIADSIIDVYAITYVKDKETDMVEEGSKIYRDLFEQVVDQLMKNTDAESLYVVIDTCKELGKTVGCRIVRTAANKYEKKIVECKQVRTKDELLLQTHDFVVGSLGHFEEHGNSEYTERLSERIRKWMRTE